MMAWTDRHCRFLHRLYSPQALLFTEMITTGALIRGHQQQLLAYDPSEHPLAIQLGGNDPHELAECARIATDHGYDEINLNVGCPSDRVQRGTFGACLMRHPQLVADCIEAMRAATSCPVTVKCRLGVDDDDSIEFLQTFIERISAAGCSRVYLHARKAILGGLSPAQNRSIPPLMPERARWVKVNFPELQVIMNGGIVSVEQALDHLEWADGVMIGRAAYHHPDFLADLHRVMFCADFKLDKVQLIQKYQAYVDLQLSAGQRLHTMTRHLLSSCNALPGARRFRQTLSDTKKLKRNDSGLIDEAINHVFPSLSQTPQAGASSTGVTQ